MSINIFTVDDEKVKPLVSQLMAKHAEFVLKWLLPDLDDCRWLIYHCSEKKGEGVKERIDQLQPRQITNVVRSLFEVHTDKVVDWLLTDLVECRCLIHTFYTREKEKGSLLLLPTVSDSGSANKARVESNGRLLPVAVKKHPFEDMTPDQEVGCVCLLLLRIPGCVSVFTIAFQLRFSTEKIETILGRSHAVKKFRKKTSYHGLRDTVRNTTSWYYGLRDTDGTTDIVIKNMIGDATCIEKIEEIQIRHIPVSQIVSYDDVVPYVEVSDEPMELDGEGYVI